MRLFLHELADEQRLFWRSREPAFFMFLFPLLLFVTARPRSTTARSTASRRRRPPRRHARLRRRRPRPTPGSRSSLVIRRESGVLKRVRATPLPPPGYLGAVIVSTSFVFAHRGDRLIVLGRDGSTSAPWPTRLPGGLRSPSAAPPSRPSAWRPRRRALERGLLGDRQPHRPADDLHLRRLLSVDAALPAP